MSIVRSTCIVLLALAPLAVSGAPSVPLTADTQWYVHADLLQMRQTPSGQLLYRWLEEEVLEELRDELGFDFGPELDGVTVLGLPGDEARSAALILHGFLSAETRRAVLDAAAATVGYTSQERYGRGYFRIGGASDAPGAPFDGGFLAFGDLGQTLVTGSEKTLETFLAANAHFAGAKAPAGNLITLAAASAMLHGSVDARGLSDSSGPWDSQLFRNVERLGLVVADANGLMDIEVFVTATDPTMAQAIQNIVQGFLSLEVLGDGDPEAAALLEQLEVSRDGADVRLAVRLEPRTALEFLD